MMEDAERKGSDTRRIDARNRIVVPVEEQDCCVGRCLLVTACDM